MRVLALRRSPGSIESGYAVADTGDPDGVAPHRFFPPEALHDLLVESDYVVIALPLTRATHHIIGEAELRAMKATAFLVNIARGPIVDEAALARALGEGWIAGAGLDVFEEEPLLPGSPLWDLENLLKGAESALATLRTDREEAVRRAAGKPGEGAGFEPDPCGG